jgi:hypothetical protein
MSQRRLATMSQSIAGVGHRVVENADKIGTCAISVSAGIAAAK